RRAPLLERLAHLEGGDARLGETTHAMPFCRGPHQALEGDDVDADALLGDLAIAQGQAGLRQGREDLVHEVISGLSAPRRRRRKVVSSSVCVQPRAALISGPVRPKVRSSRRLRTTGSCAKAARIVSTSWRATSARSTVACSTASASSRSASSW